MNSEIETLQQTVFELIHTSREQLKDGMVDLSPIEVSVRSYCEALQALPVEEASAYAPVLRDLAEKMHLLEDDLQRARWAVQQQLTSLNRIKTAEMAYRKTDHMGEVLPLPINEDEEGL